jgi:hypothetical protein
MQEVEVELLKEADKYQMEDQVEEDQPKLL